MLLDSETIELFGGMMVFDSMLILVDAVLLLHFFFLWYKNWRRTGVKLDYWNFFCFQSVVLPLFILYPFAGSYANYFATGDDILFIVQYVDQAFCISVIGYVCMFLGRWGCNAVCKADALGFFETYFYRNLKNDKFYVYMEILSIIVLVSMTFFTYRYPDYIFNLRAVSIFDEGIRPILIFFVSIATHGIMIFLLYAWGEKKKRVALYALLFVLTPLLGGMRGPVFAPLLTMCALFTYFYKEKIRFIYIMGVGVVSVGLVLILSVVREGVFDFSGVSWSEAFLMDLLYGNTFSDLRDFAWVLTGFHDDFLLGKTYLSGWLSVLPSGFFEYRRTYGLGVITNQFAGITFEHFGLRAGIFGEAYLNFGYLGIIVVGGLLGYQLQKLSTSLQWAVDTGKDVYYCYSKILVFSMMSSAITISSGMPMAYVIIGIHFLWKIVDAVLPAHFDGCKG